MILLVGALHSKSVKFSDYRHCGSGDKMFLVVGKQDYTCFYLDSSLGQTKLIFR